MEKYLTFTYSILDIYVYICGDHEKSYTSDIVPGPFIITPQNNVNACLSLTYTPMNIEKILEAGERHFFAKQYSDVKLDNIANDLGIKKPSLYYYFTNKREYYIQTLKYSMKKYFAALKEVTQEKDLRGFIARYLDYPSKEKNLFAIAVQKGYGDDIEINRMIEQGRQVVNTDITSFLRGYSLTPIRVFMICQLLDKLAMENCIDGYCLQYGIDELSTEIERLIEG